MRLERNSLIAVTLIVMAGCSANRQTRKTDSVYNSSEPVPMPMRHADEYDSGPAQYEYDSGPAQYEYESSPPQSDSPDRSGKQYPPAVPMREPVPAPPAIGVSRVKSVSWERQADAQNHFRNCSDATYSGGSSDGQQSMLPVEYFTEGCVTGPPATCAPSRRCREKTSVIEMLHGWRRGAKSHRNEQAQALQNSCNPTYGDPSCFAPQGVQESMLDDQWMHESPKVMPQYIGGEHVEPNTGGHGSGLAEPLQENGLGDQTGTRNSLILQDEMLQQPFGPVEGPESTLRTFEAQTSPDIEARPLLPTPNPAALQSLPTANHSAAGQSPATLPPPVPAHTQQHSQPDAVKRVTQPPLWPRRTSPAAIPVYSPKASSAEIPVAVPAVPDDLSLPTIQPGRRI